VRKTKKLLILIYEAISNGATISGVCSKFNISRNTFYRWQTEDKKFKKSLNYAKKLCEELKDDIAESEHIKLMKSGHWLSVKHQLLLKQNRKSNEREMEIRRQKYLAHRRMFYGKDCGDADEIEFMTDDEVGERNVQDLVDFMRAEDDED